MDKKIKFQEKLNYWLVTATAAAFTILGTAFLHATLYVWYKMRTNPQWDTSFEYFHYVETMNLVAFLPGLILVILLVLCLQRKSLQIMVSAIYIAATLTAAGASLFISGAKLAAGIISVSAAIYQFALLILLLSGRQIISEKAAVLEKSGSLILHIGYSLLILSWVTLNGTDKEIPVFWFAAVLITVGSILDFYSKPLSSIFTRSSTQRES